MMKWNDWNQSTKKGKKEKEKQAHHISESTVPQVNK